MIRESENNGKLPYRHFLLDTWDVFIGRNDRQNDELTTSFGRPWDLWMHVSSHAGSHVVLRREKSAAWPPQEILDKAASLAAWFSKARHAPFAKVHVTEVRHVHKMKNAPPGEVHLGKFKVLRVKPADPSHFFPDK
jgi:predicted ribosome quality control (RQC) complex YloA/Tae2 family protein